jgi:hypothetical protein
MHGREKVAEAAMQQQARFTSGTPFAELIT